MSMYHRTYTRIPLTLEVDIQFKGEKPKHAYTQNINPFGAFIELSKSTLAINDFVRLYFTDKDNGDACVVQKGIVMHCSDDGVGILFAIDNKEFRTMLGHELSHAYTTVALSP
jgi:hypothetical protein